jgi:energy-coupling factor transporter transmembrane protein EcfT
MKYWLDWLFKDFNGRRGKYVIAETPNVPLVIFMACIILAVVSDPGRVQSGFTLAAYAALVCWGIMEAHSGRSRFRKLLGYVGLLAIVGALILRLGF